MTKKLTFLIAAAVMLLTMMATTGTMWGQSDYSTTYTSGVTLSTTGGTSASTCKVIVTGTTEYDGIKAGTSKVAGAMVITVPSGTKYLHIHAAAWNNESVTLSVTPNTNISPSSISLTADSGVSGSGSTYTLGTSANASTNYYKVITFTNALTANTDLTFTASSGKRFVIWGVNAEAAGSPSTPSITASNVNLAYDATQGSIGYTLNNATGNVTAEVTTGDWLTLGTITASAVPFTCSANEAAAARTAQVTLSFTGATDKVVTVTQAGNPNVVNNIEDITAAGNYTVKGTIVAMSTRGFVLGDGTGYVYYYYGNNFSTTYTIGDVVKLSGDVTASSSYKVFQFTSSATITAATESNYVAEDPTVLSGADMDAQVASTAAVSLSNYVQYQGTLTVSGTYYNITSIDGASTAKGSISYPTSTDFTSLNGKVVTVTGYYVGVSSNQYYNTMIGSIEEVITSVATPTFSPAAGTFTTAQTVTINCTTNGAAIHYTTDGTEPDGNSTQYTEPISVSTTTTFKAKAIKGDDASAVITATYHICSAENPYTVAQALAFHEYPTSTIWVHGIVSTAPTAAPNNGQLTYYISDNGEATNQLQIYKGKGLNEASFTAQDDIQVGDIVTVTGTVKIYNTTTEFDAGNYLTSFERPVEPSITVANATVNVGAEGGEGTLTVTYENITEIAAEVWFCNAAGTEDATYDWITADINNTTNNVDYLVESNDGVERTAYFKVWAYDDEFNEVYSNLVTVTQAEYVAPTPSIAVTPTLVEATAEETDGTITVTLTAIDNNDIEVHWFESDGTTTATYDWILADVDSNNDIAYVIAENTGDARSAYFKVYGMDSEANDVYSELVTINQAAADTPVIPHVTWDLSIASYDEITDPDIVTWSSIYATMTNSSKSGGTSASNYLGGDANNRTSSRFYNGNTLTIAPSDGYAITSVVFTATSNSYASTLKNSDWTNATASMEEGNDVKVVTVTPTIGSNDIVAAIGGTCGFTAVTVYYVVDNTPSIAITPAAISGVPCLGGGGTLTVTCSNMGDSPSLSIVFCDSQGTAAEYNWISAVFNGDGNVVGTIYQNTGAARTAYLKVCGTAPNETQVCSNIVSIAQEAYNDPTTTVTSLPFAFDGSKDDIATTEGIVENGLDDGYSSSPRLKFKTQGAHVVLHFNEAPGTLTYDIKGDGFSGGTFTVMTSPDNNTYTALQTYTTLSGEIQHESFNNLDENVRYIKWIYTTKEDGKVALGNIGLTKASNEPSITANDINLAYNAEEGEIAYTINHPVEGGEVSAEVIGTATWLYLDDVDETNHKVPFNCDANIGFERSATVRLTYTYNTDQTATKDVTITQAANPDPINNISEITAEGTYAVRGTIVAKSQRGFIVGDGTGYIYYYNTSYDQSAYNIGDKVKLSGSVVAYGKVFEFNNSTTVTASTTSNYDPANAYPTELTGAQMQSIVGSSTNRLSDFVVYHGTLSVSVSGNNTYYNITNISGATTATGSISYPLNTDFASLDGEQVTVIGYFVGISSTRYNTMIGEIVKTPSIVADDVTIQYNETSGSITYTISDAASDGWFNAEVEDGSWLTITQPIGDDAVAFTCEENTGDEARSETVTLMYLYQNNQDTIEKTVTVTQQAYTAPVATITVDPAELNVNEEEHNGVLTVTYENVSTTGAEVYFCTAGGEAATYEWLDAEINNDNNVYYAMDANTGAARTAYLKVKNGDVYSNLVTINQAAYVPPVVTDDYELFSGTLVEGDYIVYYEGYAMKSKVVSNRLSYEIVEPANDVISTANDSIVWHIAPSDTTGYWTIYNTAVEKYAASTGSKNQAQLLAGCDNNNALWAVTGTETYEFENKARAAGSNPGNKWLRNNGTNGFACYANSTGGALSLYKKVDNSPSIAADNVVIEHNETSGSIIYTINNYVEGTMVATTTADWISNFEYEQVDELGSVDFTATANTTYESRSATVTLTFTYGNSKATVTKDVTVTQNGQPSITVTPATANVAFAGGAPAFTIAYESLDITSTTDFDVAYYETSTSSATITKPEWITSAVISGNTTDGFIMTVTVAANDGAAREAYLKVYALDENIEPVYSGLVTISQAEHTQLATYTLVTDASQIVSGKHYVIASGTNGNVKAMGSQASNNRNAVAVEVNNYTISETEGVFEFVINGPQVIDEVSYFTIYDTNENSTGYLYAAGAGGSSSSNHLKTRATIGNDGKGIWTISITDNKVDIIAQATGRNKMRYNSSSNCFSCYASNQQDIYLYVKNYDTDLEFYGNTTYTNLTISNNETLTITAGATLTVTGSLTNEGTAANLIIEDGGQVIYNGTGTFNATLQENVTGYGDDPTVASGWYLIASPVDGLPTSTVGTGTYDLFAYNEEYAYWYSNNGTGAPFTELHRGQGYLYANSANQLLAYAGTMGATNENIEKELSYTSTLGDDVRGFNLMGNPFTRNIKLGDMELGGTTLTQFYVMNAARTGLQSIDNASYEIKPGEGFFVQATAENQTLEFNPTSKGLEDIKFIKIVAGNENGTDNAYINLSCGNTLRKMNIADLTNVYVMNDDKDFAAARIEELAGTMPVNFEAVEDGTYTITVEAKFIEAHNMHLIDNFTGADIDLMVEPSYTFTATTNDNAERFTLVFDFNNYTGCNENYTSENFVYQSGDEIIVNGEGELKVFDVLGRFVMSQNVSGVERINKPAQTGVYIFMMNGNAQKIVVK